MADHRPPLKLVPPAPPGRDIDQLKAALVAASAERADGFVARLAEDAAEAERLVGLDFLPPGQRDRFRRVAVLLAAELAGIEALRVQRAWRS